MDNEKKYDVEIVTEQGTYGDEVTFDILQLMLKAHIVTIRTGSVEVREIEVDEQGKVKFHGNKR
ncbi:hypothetical protein ORM91_11885 [Bacillus cereus]|uniref:hypothetical protein n=1 Tax=Bacillus cereus TaxID=1396 RepID=UPI002AC0A65A|nr:hypothetical protein [Bacillus cereus]MDZ4607582.1 hypothetical protein [Bacillus cereus]